MLTALGLSAAAAGVAAQPLYPPECNCPPAAAERLAGLIGPRAAKVVDQCSKLKPAGCHHDVEVTTEAGGCVAKLNYCVICVRRKDVPAGQQPHSPTVRWTLTENGRPTNNYVFDTVRGIDIPDAGAGGKDHFNGPGRDGSKSKFKWQTGPDKSVQLPHDAKVYPREGGPACRLVDPFIVNTD